MPTTPDVDPTEPWWMVAIKYGFWAVVVIVAFWLTTRSTSKKTDAKIADVTAVATSALQEAALANAQVTNSHAGAEYPNFREEVTALRKHQEETLAAQNRQLDTIRDELGGIRSDAAKDRKAQHETLMRAMTQEVPALIAQAVAEHTTACRQAK